MEKITTEDFLTTLIKYGFDKVDPVLYAQVLRKVVLENAKEYDFDLTVSVSKAITKEGSMYRLSDKLDKDLWFKNHTNEKLLESFNNIDFEDLVFKKLAAFGCKRDDCILGTVEIDKSLFSDKELDIINSVISKKQQELDDKIAEEKRISEVRENMITSPEYIDWLIDFTDRNNGSFEERDFKDNDSLSKEDRERLNDINIFYDLIKEYVDIMDRSNYHFFAIKHNEEVFHIGRLKDSDGTHFVIHISRTDERGNIKVGYDFGATDYKEIIKMYKKYNKTFKKD